MTLYHVYTDGACSGNPGPGGWGVVILDQQEQFIMELSGFQPSTTNNRMELQAAIAGIEQALKLDTSAQIMLYSDSNYLIQAYTQGWMENWLRTNWKKGTVKNQDVWQELNALLLKTKVRWVKVKGHADNLYNNRCDQLAVAAIKHKVLEPLQQITSKQAQVPAQQESARHLQVVVPPFNPSLLNNKLSTSPAENRCLVSSNDLPSNSLKICQVAEKFANSESTQTIDKTILQSLYSWVAIATYDHPTIKVHPFFLQVGDLADLWQQNYAHAPAKLERKEIIKLMCNYILQQGLIKARELGLDNSK